MTPDDLRKIKERAEAATSPGGLINYNADLVGRLEAKIECVERRLIERLLGDEK